MATSLSLDEQRTICKLYESGKSFKEIREITGRSREAQVKVLTRVGLYKDGLSSSASEHARYNYEVHKDKIVSLTECTETIINIYEEELNKKNDEITKLKAEIEKLKS